jgi:hypothetical protein
MPKTTQCSLHNNLVESLAEGDSRMKNIDEKIDLIMSRQLTYMENHATFANDLSRIKAIVENGLKKNVEQLAAAAIEVEQKMKILDDFHWFMELVEDFRTGLFKRVLKYAFIGGIIALAYTLIISYGNRFFARLLN